jgi:hypothetical protein
MPPTKTNARLLIEVLPWNPTFHASHFVATRQDKVLTLRTTSRLFPCMSLIRSLVANRLSSSSKLLPVAVMHGLGRLVFPCIHIEGRQSGGAAYTSVCRSRAIQPHFSDITSDLPAEITVDVQSTAFQHVSKRPIFDRSCKVHISKCRDR